MTAKRQSISVSFDRRRMLQGALAAGGLGLVGCSANLGSNSPPGTLLAWPAEDRWPAMFHEAAPGTRAAYRFAVANRDLLRWMPCFCGCGDTGHTSNFDCYVREIRGDGAVLLDSMSFG
jgi:hypothetical protein